MSYDGTESEVLPDGWVRTYSNRVNRYYYSHIGTKTSQWHFPTSSEVRDPSLAKRLDEENREKFFKAQKGEENLKRKMKDTYTSSYSSNEKTKKPLHSNGQSINSHSIAIIVPYRDLHVEQNRAKHLAQFLPHMQTFLEKLQQKQRIWNYHVYIIEQSDDKRKFNRGKLLNIGFDYAVKLGNQNGWNHDIFIFHDVDLLPGDDLGNWYAKYPKNPLHIARCWDRYSNNEKYFGGIVSFSANDMRRINGFPNTFWGWGGEDDEMQKRCEKLKIKWEAPPKVSVSIFFFK